MLFQILCPSLYPCPPGTVWCSSPPLFTLVVTCHFNYPWWWPVVQKQMSCLIYIYGHKVNSSLMLCHSASLHVITWHFIISNHHKKGDNSMIYSEREATFINFYDCLLLLCFLVISLLLCLIYKLSFIIGMHVQEKAVFMGVVLSAVSGIL